MLGEFWMESAGGFVERDLGGSAGLDEELAVSIAEYAVTSSSQSVNQSVNVPPAFLFPPGEGITYCPATACS